MKEQPKHISDYSEMKRKTHVLLYKYQGIFGYKIICIFYNLKSIFIIHTMIFTNIMSASFCFINDSSVGVQCFGENRRLRIWNISEITYMFV